MSLEDYKKAGMEPPFYLKNKNHTRGQVVTFCKKCKDTSFELLEKKRSTGKCCRCGEKYK